MTGDGDARILVVDDVPENVRLLEAVLVSHGYEVDSAADGLTALELVESAVPDLVLLDVLMPDIDSASRTATMRPARFELATSASAGQRSIP